jgi:hypothetical protein
LGRLERLEDRTVPAGAFGPDNQWLLQIDGLAGPAPVQLQQIQQRLSGAGVNAVAIRHLGLDGLALIQTWTVLTYPDLHGSLVGVEGYRYVRANQLERADIFLSDTPSAPAPIPREWVLHVNGMTGSPAAQEQQVRLYVEAAGAQVHRHLGRDGVFAIRSAPDRSFADLDQALRAIPGYRKLEANTIGWVLTHLPTYPFSSGGTASGEWLVQFHGVTGTRTEQAQEIQRRLDAAGVNVTVKQQLGSDGLVTIIADPGRSYEDLHRALGAVPGYQGETSPNFRIQIDNGPPTLRVAAAGAGGGPHVQVLDERGAVRLSFLAYGSTFTGGVSVAAADVTGDGVPDVVTAPGPGGGPHVKVFDGRTGGLVREWTAYGPTFRGGVSVAAADVTGDGVPDVVTGAGPGGGPHVKVFDGITGQEVVSFLAYDPTFLGGVTVAAGDVLGTGRPVVVTAPGSGGGPHVRVFDAATGQTVREWLAYDPAFRGGVFVAAGPGRVITGAGPGGAPHVKVFAGSELAETQSFLAYAPTFTGGVRVATSAGVTDPLVVTAPGPGGGPDVRDWSVATGQLVGALEAFDPRFTGGVFVSGPVRHFSAEVRTMTFDFRQGEQGWSSGFADLPVDAGPIYELDAGLRPLPAELGAGTGFMIQGHNRSDDLFMFLKRGLGAADGIRANQAYRVRYAVTFGSNAPTGGAGIGGPPGEAVFLKAGAGAVEPQAVPVGGDLRMNVDKGNQAVGGRYASVLGDIANGQRPVRPPSPQPYVAVTRTGNHAFPATADAAGNLWLLVGTDSGFEGLTRLYYMTIAVTLTPIPG